MMTDWPEEAARYFDWAGWTRDLAFDHTVVDPGLRGTGLSGLLAEHALTDDIVKGRKIQASCWYIEGYLERNPHLAS